jgi:hypothetical protein
VHCVAARIEHGGVAIGNFVMYRPDIARRHDHTLGECTCSVYANNRCLATEMRAAGAAEPAMAAGDVAFTADTLAARKMVDSFANLRDAADEFMAHDARRLHPSRRPLIPFPDVEIRAAHAGHADGDFDFTGAWCAGCLDLGIAQSGFGTRFQNGEHGHPRWMAEREPIRVGAVTQRWQFRI